MTEEEAELEERRKTGEIVLAAPGEFKVCEACGSIIYARAVFCPQCNGYRFDDQAGAVVLRIQTISIRPSQSPDFD